MSLFELPRETEYVMTESVLYDMVNDIYDRMSMEDCRTVSRESRLLNILVGQYIRDILERQ